MLWELQEGPLEAMVPEMNPEGKAVVGPAEGLRRVVQTEGDMESEAGASVALEENPSISSGWRAGLLGSRRDGACVCLTEELGAAVRVPAGVGWALKGFKWE